MENIKETLKKIYNDKKNFKEKVTVLFSPASASYDKYKNFEERGNDFKKIVKYNVKNFVNSEKLNDYWRNIDKKILFCFLTLFLGVFFHFLQPPFLQVKGLIKIFIFFSKHLVFSVLAISLMIIISYLDISILKKA